jgi:hypothetical protein
MPPGEADHSEATIQELMIHNSGALRDATIHIRRGPRQTLRKRGHTDPTTASHKMMQQKSHAEDAGGAKISISCFLVLCECEKESPQRHRGVTERKLKPLCILCVLCVSVVNRSFHSLNRNLLL